MVCAMGGARRRRGFEPRFVCPSRGPPVRSPPPPPSAAPSTIGTAGGWVACLVLVLFPVKLCPLVQHKNQVPDTAHLQQCPPSLVPPSAATASPPRTPLPPCPGFEPGSSRLQLAAQPLQHAAENLPGPPAPFSAPVGQPQSLTQSTQWLGLRPPSTAHESLFAFHCPPPPPRGAIAPRRDGSRVPCTRSAPQMVGRNRANSHGSATAEPHTLYFSHVY